MRRNVIAAVHSSYWGMYLLLVSLFQGLLLDVVGFGQGVEMDVADQLQPVGVGLAVAELLV